MARNLLRSLVALAIVLTIVGSAAAEIHSFVRDQNTTVHVVTVTGNEKYKLTMKHAKDHLVIALPRDHKERTIGNQAGSNAVVLKRIIAIDLETGTELVSSATPAKDTQIVAAFVGARAGTTNVEVEFVTATGARIKASIEITVVP